MGDVKRSLSLPVVWFSFLGAALYLMPGVWLLASEAGQSVPLPDFALLFDPAELKDMAAAIKTALPAALMAAAGGFVIGYLRISRTGRILWASILPAAWLTGLFFLYAKRILPYLPEGAAAFLSSMAALPVSRTAAMALGLMTPAAACAGAFACAARPALYRAARDLGASRLRAYVTFLLPRALFGLPIGLFVALLPGAGLALLDAPEVSLAYAVPACAALLLMTLALLMLCRATQKDGRIFPC